MVLSATSATATAAGEPPYEAVMKQGVFAVLGIPLMFIASRLPIGFWKRAAWPAPKLGRAAPDAGRCGQPRQDVVHRQRTELGILDVDDDLALGEMRVVAASAMV